MLRWGVVTTVKAPIDAVLNFVAWHLDLGAHRIYVHLDAPDEDLLMLLKAHPKVRPTLTGAGYWKQRGGKRPVKHQVRQSVNASRVLARPAEVDWLAHIDVDEFIVADSPVSEILARLGSQVRVARMRPIEALAHQGPVSTHWYCKAMTLDRPTRRAQSERLFPRYGQGLEGGFLSHVAGKLFVNTELAGSEFRIHNVFQDAEMNPGHQELDAITVCHLHAPDLATWLAHFRFRHDKGSYRAELKPPKPAEEGGVSTHELLAAIDRESGEDGLKAFFSEVCTARPDLIEALRGEGLLREVDLDFAAARARHFPGYGG